jgi:hypothetical protein
MRRIPRFDRSVDLLHSRSVSRTSVPYLCSACRLQTAKFSTSQVPYARGSYTERIRQKIWGTSEPPGLEDPYGGPSNIEKKKAAKKASKASRLSRARESRPPPKPYKRATTWDGLEELGQPEPKPLPFSSFVPAEVITDGDEITTCLHRAMVEVLACSQAGRSLSDVWSMEPTVDQTHKIEIKPSEGGVEIQFSDGMTREQLLESLSPLAVEHTIETLADETASEEITATAEQPGEEISVQSIGAEETSVKATPADAEEGVPETQQDVDAVVAAPLTYYDVVKSWDPSWLQISLFEADIKFAVSVRSPIRGDL